jgi:hypothetical protein
MMHALAGRQPAPSSPAPRSNSYPFGPILFGEATIVFKPVDLLALETVETVG